jgi:hypothetical protein
VSPRWHGGIIFVIIPVSTRWHGGIIIVIIPVSTRWHGGIIIVIIPVSTRWHGDEWFRRRLEESRHGDECFRRRILIIIITIIIGFFLCDSPAVRGAPCGGGGTRLVGMVAGLMRLVFAMPTKAISQRSFMWYFKSDYTRLNNYMHLLWVAAQANMW